MADPTGKGNMDFHYDLTEYRTTPKGPLRFKLKVTVCNRLDRRVKGKLVENPWKKSGSKVWVLKYGYGHDAQSAIGNGQEVELALKGDKDGKDCVTKTWEFDVRPDIAYTDLYEYDDKGKLNKEYTDGWTQQLESKKVAWLPKNKAQYVAITFPVPYQMSLDGMTKGAIKVAVDRVEGIPKGFVVSNCFPSVDCPVTLQHGDRQSEGSVILHQTSPLPAGRRYSLRIVQTILSPAELRVWPKRVFSVDLEGEAKPTGRIRRKAGIGRRRK
jgi:hypothetical protein